MELRGKRWGNDLVLAKMQDKKVTSLGLFNTAVDDAFLRRISAEGTLRSLHITSDLITDGGIIAVAESCQIESLLLSDVVNVTDRALIAIAGCQTLRELYLGGTAITDQGIGLLRQLPDLWSLVINNTRITDAGIRSLGPNTINLISFANCGVEGLGCSTWRQNKKMSFYSDGSKLSDEGFATVCSSFSRMWTVSISDTNVGDVGIKALLGQCPAMLRIAGTRITKAGIEWIVDSLPVELLEIDSTQMSEPEISSLPKPRKLRIIVHG